nr:MAG TPA: hypothetical protein [Bacteriophage sp.]
MICHIFQIYLYFDIKTNTILTNCISLCTKKYEICAALGFEPSNQVKAGIEPKCYDD